jgi:O-antigen ligase
MIADRIGPVRADAVPVACGLAAAAAIGVLSARAPVQTAGVTVGVLALGVLLWRADLALYTLIVATTLESAFAVSGNEQLSLTKLAGAVSFASFALHVVVRRQRLHLDRLHGIVLVLLGVALVSSLQARSMPDGLATSVRLASFVALIIVVSNLARDARVLVRIIWVVAASAAAAAALGIYNFLSGATLLARLTYGDPNDFAFHLAVAVPFTLWLIVSLRGARRAVALALIGLQVAGIGLSLSRGAVLGLGLGLVWHALTERRHRRLLVAAAGIGVMLMMLFIQTNPERVAAGLSAKEFAAQDNVDSRLEAWQGALGLAADRPLLGVGPGNFGSYYYEFTGNPVGTFALQVAHNSYFDVAAELGVSGFALFASFLLMVFSRAGAVMRAGAGPPGLASLVRTALVVVMVCFLTVSVHYFAPIWLVGGIATALYWEATSAYSR